MTIEVCDVHGAPVMFSSFFVMGYSRAEAGDLSTLFLQQTELCKMAWEKIEGCRKQVNWQRGRPFTPKISETLNNMDSVDMCTSIHMALLSGLPMIFWPYLYSYTKA